MGGTVLDFMKRLVSAAAILLSAFPVTRAATPAPLTTLRAVAALTNAEASQHQPVFFEATVTYYRGYERNLFVQDGGDAIYVDAPSTLNLVPGDRVVVRGTTHASFRPYVESNDITRVGHGALPIPLRPTFEQMVRAETDCKYVTVRARVRSDDLAPSPASGTPTLFLQMFVDGGEVDANVDSANENDLKGLLDAEVEVTGVASEHFDNKMQQTGILLNVGSMTGIKILKRAGSDPWMLPVTPMDRVIEGYRPVEDSQRLRVEGTITYYEPGVALVLQDGPKSLWIATENYGPLRIGDRASAIGFPDVQNGFLTLTRSEVRDTLVQAPVNPSLFTWRDLALGGNNAASHSFDLVSIEGQVVAQVRLATQDEYVLEHGGYLFSAILRHPKPLNHSALPPLKQVPPGSRIRVTGICMLTDANPFNGEVPFNILMRSDNDIQIADRPPWLNISHVTELATLLLLLALLLGARGWLLELKTRRQIVSLAYVEQRRSKILEDINHSKPLAPILDRITELVSMRLNGAPCWCQVADGAIVGNRPQRLESDSLRTAEQPIESRSGPPHGCIYAAFNARTKSHRVEKEALAMAAELATLAIETSHLYSDLVHRSEFDLLTDVQNRFAMEKTLNAMMIDARQSSGKFGVIFVDLNEFKQVNDLHGHLVGDRYLQEAAQRMKHQLRPGDTLARLGGDEFAALIPDVHNRAQVEEIAARLERCFDKPFLGDGFVLRGSASVGVALYPEDAASADSLMHAADAAMYVAKYTRSGKSHTVEVLPDDALTRRGSR